MNLQRNDTQDVMSQQKSFSSVDNETHQKTLANTETAARIASDSLQPGAFGDQLPPEYDPSGSALGGLRTLLLSGWLFDRIRDGILGHENAETVQTLSELLFIDFSTDFFLAISIRLCVLNIYLCLYLAGR